jgi:hypothetical protein
MLEFLLLGLLADGCCDKSVRIVSAKQAARERRIRRQKWLGAQAFACLCLLLAILSRLPTPVTILIIVGICWLYWLGARRKTKSP